MFRLLWKIHVITHAGKHADKTISSNFILPPKRRNRSLHIVNEADLMLLSVREVHKMQINFSYLLVFASEG